jgi:hypothetical protein
MRPEDIHQLLHKEPFQPFRLHLSNGRTYEVRHPELALVGRTTVFIGVPAADLSIPVYDVFDLVSLVHINNVEPIPKNAPPSTNGPGQ